MTSNSKKVRAAGMGTTMSPCGSVGMIVNGANPVLIPCFVDPYIVRTGDSKPYQSLLYPGEQHLFLAEDCLLAGA